jgi:hypothetical protein
MDSAVQSALIAATAVLLAKPVENYFEKRKKLREQLRLLNEKPDLSDEDYYDKIGEILEHIQEATQAHRVFYLAAQNGEKTLDNYSIKKLSMMVEKNAEGVDDIIQDIQNVPVVVFKRNINALKESPSGYHVTEESDLIDRLSRINVSYGVNTLLSFKVLNIKHNEKWTGILGIGFEECSRPIAETEIAWCSLQVSRIESIISKI